MQQRKSPVLQQTAAKIRALLEKEADGNSLPSIRTLSEQFVVSPVTVMRAIKLLKSEGLVSSRWGKGSGNPGTQPVSVEIGEAGKFKRTLNQFKKDILGGIYQTHLSLPPVNQLTAHYNASYPTIRKVLTTLLNESILKRNGARYYFFTNRLRHNQKIAIVAFGQSRESIKIETERERNFYRLLSSTAADSHIDLEIICYNDYLNEPCFYTPDNKPLEDYLKSSGICGIILSSYHMNNSAECLARLLTYNISVSAWIEDSRILNTVDRFGAHYKKLTFFDTSYTTIPGYDIGRYLLDRGHRAIAFISPFHGSPWSQNRLKGLRKAVALHSDATVYPFIITEYINDYYYLIPVLEKSDFDRHFLPDTINRDVHDFLRSRVASIRYEHDTLLRDNAIFAVIKDAVDQITSNKLITALVCVNDLVAGLITDYWNYYKVPVDNRPVLIGFDNSFKSLQQQFSSYEFNTQGEIQNMISHVLYPENPLFSKVKPVIRLSGTVIERASSQWGKALLQNDSQRTSEGLSN